MSNIRIEIAQPEQKEALTDFLVEYFRVDEPITRAVNLSKEEARPFFEELVADGLKQPITFVALNENGKVVGCRLNEIADLHTADHRSTDVDPPNYSETVKKICGFLDILTKDVEQLLPREAKRILKFIVVSVHPQYQRRGIAQELVKRSMQLAADQHCDYVCVGATAMRTQQMFEQKLGFQVLRTIFYSDYRDPISDLPVIVCDDGTTCGKFLAKKLR